MLLGFAAGVTALVFGLISILKLNHAGYWFLYPH